MKLVASAVIAFAFSVELRITSFDFLISAYPYLGFNSRSSMIRFEQQTIRQRNGNDSKQCKVNERKVYCL